MQEHTEEWEKIIEIEFRRVYCGKCRADIEHSSSECLADKENNSIIIANAIRIFRNLLAEKKRRILESIKKCSWDEIPDAIDKEI